MNKKISITEKKLNRAAFRILQSMKVLELHYTCPSGKINYATHLIIDLEKLGQVTDNEMQKLLSRGPKSVERARYFIEVINNITEPNINSYKKRYKKYTTP